MTIKEDYISNAKRPSDLKSVRRKKSLKKTAFKTPEHFSDHLTSLGVSSDLYFNASNSTHRKSKKKAGVTASVSGGRSAQEITEHDTLEAALGYGLRNYRNDISDQTMRQIQSIFTFSKAVIRPNSPTGFGESEYMIIPTEEESSRLFMKGLPSTMDLKKKTGGSDISLSLFVVQKKTKTDDQEMEEQEITETGQDVTKVEEKLGLDYYLVPKEIDLLYLDPESEDINKTIPFVHDSSRDSFDLTSAAPFVSQEQLVKYLRGKTKSVDTKATASMPSLLRNASKPENIKKAEGSDTWAKIEVDEDEEAEDELTGESEEESSAEKLKLLEEALKRKKYRQLFKILRLGPSCPDLMTVSRTMLDSDSNFQTLNRDEFDIAYLDFLLVMNMMHGNWGIDEDAFITQMFFKFIHDESLRKRSQKECHSLIDECECSAHEKITTEKLLTLENDAFYEIEQEEEKGEIIGKLREEFQRRYRDEMNLDMEYVINPGPDSDDDYDTYFDENIKPPRPKTPEIVDFDEPVDWLKLQSVNYATEPQFLDKPHSEEALLMRLGYPIRPEKIKVDRLRMKDMLKKKERRRVEEVVEQLFTEKSQQFRYDEVHGIKWRPKKTFAYKKPNWNTWDPKRAPSDDISNENKIDELSCRLLCSMSRPRIITEKANKMLNETMEELASTSRQHFKSEMNNLKLRSDSWVFPPIAEVKKSRTISSAVPNKDTVSDKFALAFISERNRQYYDQPKTSDMKPTRPRGVSYQIQAAKGKVRLSSELHIDPTFKFDDQKSSDDSTLTFEDWSFQEPVKFGGYGAFHTGTLQLSDTNNSPDSFKITKHTENPSKPFQTGFPLAQYATDSLLHMDSWDVRYNASIEAGTYTPTVNLKNKEIKKETSFMLRLDSKVYRIPRDKSIQVPNELVDTSCISRIEDWETSPKRGPFKKVSSDGNLASAAGSLPTSQPDFEEEEEPDSATDDPNIFDYIITMNLMNGVWANDEDAFLMQLYFKLKYDKSLRKRAIIGCHSLIDECDCSVHRKHNTEELMDIDESNLYEIETDEDRMNVVSRLRRTYRDEYERDNTFDSFLNQTWDGDEDEECDYSGDYYSEEREDGGERRDWREGGGKTRERRQHHSEESIFDGSGRVGKGDDGTERYRGPVGKGVKDVEADVQKMYKKKDLMFKHDSWHGLKGRIKKTYVHCKPNWNASGC